MADTDQVQPQGERLRKAIRWLSETQADTPRKKRDTLLREAEIRFDLTPRECEFLEKNFSHDDL